MKGLLTIFLHLIWVTLISIGVYFEIKKHFSKKREQILFYNDGIEVAEHLFLFSNVNEDLSFEEAETLCNLMSEVEKNPLPPKYRKYKWSEIKTWYQSDWRHDGNYLQRKTHPEIEFVFIDGQKVTGRYPRFAIRNYLKKYIPEKELKDKYYKYILVTKIINTIIIITLATIVVFHIIKQFLSS